MRVLLIEAAADGLLDLAIRAKQNGHNCRYHCGAYHPSKHPIGRGLVEHVGDWRGSARWADLIVAGGTKWCHELDRVRSLGVPVIGACAEVAKLELDRAAGMQAFERYRIPVPPYRLCATVRDAIEHIEKQGEGCAVKPCGDIGDKSTSIVGKSVDELLWRLKRWIRQGKSFPSGLIVQDLVQGVEFAVGAWVGPDGWAEGIEENFEEKRFFTGGLGPNTGEMGTVMRLVRRSKLFDMVLKPFEDMLVRSGYVGNIDVNCIVDEEGTAWPLEFTCRLGWPAFNIELALHKGDPIEFLAGLAAGDPPSSRRLDEVAVGIVCAIPPYPFGHENPDDVVGVPIWGVTPGIEDNLHFCAVEQQGGQLETAGSYVLVSTGTGSAVTEARNQAIRVLNRLALPVKPYWRIDIGSRLRSGLDSLQEHGYATNLRYA